MKKMITTNMCALTLANVMGICVDLLTEVFGALGGLMGVIGGGETEGWYVAT